MVQYRIKTILIRVGVGAGICLSSTLFFNMLIFVYNFQNITDIWKQGQRHVLTDYTYFSFHCINDVFETITF
jgi:hypothetical protein